MNLLPDYCLLFVDTHLFLEAIQYQEKIKKSFIHAKFHKNTVKKREAFLNQYPWQTSSPHTKKPSQPRDSTTLFLCKNQRR